MLQQDECLTAETSTVGRSSGLEFLVQFRWYLTNQQTGHGLVPQQFVTSVMIAQRLHTKPTPVYLKTEKASRISRPDQGDRPRGDRNGDSCHLHAEVTGVGVVEDEGGDGGLGLHHVAFGEGDADLFGLEGGEELALHGEVGAGWVAEAVALAAVAG